jgi:hypothetical protein
MSIQDPAPYGVREFDLSVSRANEKITVKADNFAILSAEDSATIRVNSPDAAGIPAREISGLTIAKEEGKGPGIERIYLSNSSGSGKLRLLTGFGVASGSTSTPSDDTTDVSNRAARELGKARLEDSGGVLIDPADKTLFENKGSLTAFSVSSDGQLPSNTVPDGIEVSVIADPSNAATTDLNGDIPLPAGSALDLRIENTDLLDVAFNGSGSDSISVVYEG